MFVRGDGSPHEAAHTHTHTSQTALAKMSSFFEPTEKTWHKMLGSLEVTREGADKG